MRVTEAYEILERNIPRLSMPPHKETRIHGNAPGFRYTEMSQLIEAVTELSTVPGLQSECAILQGMSFMQTGKDWGVATQDDWNALSAAAKQLVQIATRLREVLGSMDTETSPNTIAVKLPEVKDLADMKRLIGELQIALERPVQLVLKEHIRVEGVDRGSMWLMLAGSAILAVRFTFGLLCAANQYLRKQAELDRYVEGTKALASANSYVDSIQAVNVKMMEACGDALTKQLLEGRKVDGEAVATTLKAIKTLAELRRQGLEMQLSAHAPKELKDVYNEFILKDPGFGEFMPKVPPQLTAGAEDAKAHDANPGNGESVNGASDAG